MGTWLGKSNGGLWLERLALRLFVLLPLAGCGSGETGKPVRVTLLASYPFAVSISHPVIGQCTGTLLSAKAVLTAGHCVAADGSYAVTTSAGELSSSAIVRLGGAGAIADDIALILFDTPFSEGTSFPTVGATVAAGDTLRLLGAGCTDYGTKGNAGVLRAGTNRVSSITDLIRLVTPLTVSIDAMRAILGPDDAVGVCAGDSGGPAIRETAAGKATLVGVARGYRLTQDELISHYVDLTQPTQRDFLERANEQYGLGITFDDD